MSFRFLNPRLVDEFDPYREDGVCYHGATLDDPDVLCRDIPPNRLRFLGWWYITPERHFLEWVVFVVTGAFLLILLGPKIGLSPSKPTSSGTNTHSLQLAPRFWMKASSLLFYPYVSYTKLSWEGSNYPGRWLLFACMPVGTMWILSALFCCLGSGKNSAERAAPGQGGRSSTNQQHQAHSSAMAAVARYWLLEIWLSFLPILGSDLLLGLFAEAIESIAKAVRTFGATIWGTSTAKDGENATICYFFHGLYLVLAPVFYVAVGELTMHPAVENGRNNDQCDAISSIPTFRTRGRDACVVLWKLAVECALRQAVGTAIATLYYMGIVTPASIVAGLNVNFLLYDFGETPSFRIYYVLGWFRDGWLVRFGLGTMEMAVRSATAWLLGTQTKSE